MLPETTIIASDRPPAGRIVKARLRSDPRSCYLTYVPRHVDPQRPPLVCVHGISRDARGHLDAFVQWAEHTGTILLAPLFDRRRYRGYQRLKSSNQRLHAAAMLDAIIDQATGARQCLLYGFSGGAQFAHRYALVRPSRVAGLALAAAGWYTFPTDSASFPHGTAPGRLPQGLDTDLPGFLAVPKCVLIGDLDVERDMALRSNRRLDREQGDNRLARATAWVNAVNRVAQRAPGRPVCRLIVIPGVGHDWRGCYETGRMHDHVTGFLDSICPSARSASSLAGDIALTH